MDDKDWKYFEVLAEEKSISKAAEKLYISQPALSYRIKHLEAELHMNLIIRTPTGILLTPQGEAFLQYALKMQEDFKATHEYLESISDTTRGTISIGCSSIFAHYELPALLKNFLAEYPLIDVEIMTGFSEKAYKALLRGNIHLAILHGEYFWAEQKVHLQEEPICLVCHKSIQADAISNQPLLRYKTDPALQQIIENWCNENYDRLPTKFMHLDSMDTCRQFALEGLGCTILPYMGLQHNDNLTIEKLYWKSGQLLSRQTEVLYHKEAERLPAIRAFLQFVQNYFNKKAPSL